MPRGSVLPQDLAMLPRYARPAQLTPLALWLQSRGISRCEFARALAIDEKTAGYWILGQALPSLVNAFKVERYTEGGVPVSSWLGTEIGRAQWRAERRPVLRVR